MLGIGRRSSSQRRRPLLKTGVVLSELISCFHTGAGAAATRAVAGAAAGLQDVADLDGRVGGEGVVGQGEVQRCWPLADAARGVVNRAVAGAEVGAIRASRVGRLVAQRHAAEVGADPDDDQPLRLLDALLVGLRVAQLGDVDLPCLLDLLRRPVTHEDRLFFAYASGGSL